jgi:hypothetical protein
MQRSGESPVDCSTAGPFLELWISHMGQLRAGNRGKQDCQESRWFVMEELLGLLLGQSNILGVAALQI